MRRARTSLVVNNLLDEEPVDPETVKRAVQVLKEAEFFQAKEEEQVGLIAQLARSVSFIEECAGQLLFRQDDPAQNCYVVVRGSVAVHIFNPEDDIPDARFGAPQEGPVPPTPRTEFPTYLYSTLSDHRRQVEAHLKATSAEPEPERFRTSEGNSTFAKDSTLGRRVAVLGPGSVVGELALSNDAPRSATIRCIHDCEFLLVPKRQFTNVLAELIEKHQFFDQAFPVLRTCEYQQVDPCSLFRRQVFPPGYAFFNEGIAPVDQALFVVFSGSVEFRRFRRASDNKAYLLAGRPLDAPEGHQAALATNRAQSPAALAPLASRSLAVAVHGAPGTGSAAKAANVATTARWGLMGAEGGLEDVWDTVEAGTAFCPLNFFPIGGGEPFTVAAGSEGCVAFYVAGAPVQQLPGKFVKAVRKMLLQDLRRRLALVEVREGPFLNDAADKPAVPSRVLPPLPGAASTGSRAFWGTSVAKPKNPKATSSQLGRAASGPTLRSTAARLMGLT